MSKFSMSFCLIVSAFAALYAAPVKPGTYSADSIVVKTILNEIGAEYSVSDVSDSANGRITILNLIGLNNKDLSILPKEIGDLNALCTLYVAGFSILPAEIGNLSALTYLDLSDNFFKSLPAEIGNLSALTNLNLSSNNLSSLPAAIGNLNSLSQLDISFNVLSSLPTQIGNLRNLDTLLANNNNLNNLPASIITLSKLTYLNLSYDSLTELPDNINQMDSLQFLFLNNNKLTTLPGKIIYLKIPLEHVFLRRFRPNCESTCGYFIDTLTYNLFLSGNQLCNLPDSINNWVNQYAPGDLQKQICANGVKYVSKIQPSSLLKMTQTPSGLMISGTSLPDENLELKVISTNGRLIKSDKLHGSSGQLSYMLQKSFLAKGMNIIQISGINCRYLLHTIVK